MSQNDTRDARSATSQDQNSVTHLATRNIDRNTSRSPSPPSSATSSFDGGCFSSISTTPITNSAIQLPEPPIFTGLSNSNINYKDWSTMMLAKLTEMTEAKVEEQIKMEYVVNHTGREVYQKLLERFEEMKGKGVAFGSAKPMVMYLAQYYDEQIRMIDIRFSTW